MQETLFQTPDVMGSKAEKIYLPGGEIALYRNWMHRDEASVSFEKLRTELAWEQSIVQIHGRKVLIPRLNAWYGDPGAEYGYSGIRLKPRMWTSTLEAVKFKVEATVASEFNSVLANLYRDGRDSVSWHSDDEIELGTNPIIASVSLGAQRRFVLKHRRRKNLAKLELWLPHGSLLLMTGATQHNWYHQLPKTTRPVQPRINLTFRNIQRASPLP